MPTLVQHVTTPNTDNISAGSNGFTVSLPNATLASNTIVAWVVGTGAPSACNDDKSNSYTLRQHTSNSNGAFGGPLDLYLYVCEGATAGATKVIFTFSGQSYFSGGVAEYCNVASSGVYETGNATSGSSASWSAGLLTTVADGDMIYQVGQNCDLLPGWFAAGYTFTAGTSGLHLEALDLGYGMAVQSGIQTTHGGITPTITASHTAQYMSVAVALKNGTSGTAPTLTPRIVHLTQMNLQTTSAGPLHLYFPCTENLLHLSWNPDTADTTDSVTAISDGTNTWHQVTGSPLTNGYGQMWYTYGATPSYTLAPVLTISASDSEGPGGIAIFYDINGASTTSQPQTQNTATGSQGSHGNLTTVSVTPTVASGLAIFYGDNDFSTMLGCVADANSHTPLFNTPFWTGQDEGGAGGAGGFFTVDAMGASCLVTDTLALTAVYSESATAAAAWKAIGVVYNAAPSNPVVTVSPATQTVVQGATATFTVAATTSGGALSYQWYQAGSAVGTNSTTYTTPATLASDTLSAVYCDVTDSNGTTHSDHAELVVVPLEAAWPYCA